jgi:hypothetical protein
VLALRDPTKHQRLANEFSDIQSRMNTDSRSDLPIFVETFHPIKSSTNSELRLCSTWEELVIMMYEQGVDIRYCGAIA